MVITKEIAFETQGNCDIQNITSPVTQAVRSSGLQAGTVTVFCPGATGGVMTMEYEAGLLADLRQVLDEIVPPDRDYLHGVRAGENNGHSHVRAALVGSSLTIPVTGGKLILGAWQQILFLDFDTRPRSRRLIVQMMGE